MNAWIRSSAFAVCFTVALLHAEERSPYIERGLEARSGELSVIVTARNSRAASTAVLRAGGRVTSDLWIANAVGATLSGEALTRLSADPAVVSIVDNKTVRTAADEWNGWVSDLRIKKGRYTLSSQNYAPVTHLRTGGFAVVAENGQVVIVNPDGTERGRVTLTQGGPFYGEIVEGMDGTLFVPGVYGVMYGVNPNGTIRWTNSVNFNTNYYYARGVISTDGTFYNVSYLGTVFGFDPATGFIKWQYTLNAKTREFPTAAVIGPDNTLYVSNVDGEVFAVTPAGVRWSVAMNGGGKGSYSGASPVLAGGTLWVTNGTKLSAFDAATGAPRVTFIGDGTFLGSPTVAPDGDILVNTATKMYSLTPIGQTRWAVPPPTKQVFARPPIIAPDNTAIYVELQPDKGKKVSFVNSFSRANGMPRWATPYQAVELIAGQLAIDPSGGILFADKGTSIYRLDADGIETHRLKTHETILDISQASVTGNIVVRLATTPTMIDFMGRLPEAWNGKKDVEPSDTTAGQGQRFKLASNYSVDVGADVLHHRKNPDGTAGYIRGTGVGVAVVDSGVFWDPSTKALMGVDIQKGFIGQADFVEKVCPTGLFGCSQRADHALYDYNTSRDSYGHGTHVAGSISNKIVDDNVSDSTNGIQRWVGVAPEARILSVRVLGPDGNGSYETVIKGIQHVVDNKATYGIRVMNLSLSAYATVPYFVDPLNRAVERAWQAGIVVVAAAGNTGPFAQSITVPGNSPYVITVGAVSSNRTAGYWRDDIVPQWSASGPTFDGFPKPDIVAPGSQIVSYMYNGGFADPNTAMLVKLHPDYSSNAQLFRMNGTSMATGVVSGVVALMLQAHPYLTPDQVKYRLTQTARPALEKNGNGDPVFNTMQQGMGRVWAPDAVLAAFDPSGRGNADLNLAQDLSYGYDSLAELAYHYQGPVRRVLSDDGTAWLYYVTTNDGTTYALGVTTLSGQWLDTYSAMRYIWSGMRYIWSGGISFSGDANTFSSMRYIWSGGNSSSWGSMRYIWSGTRYIWSGMRYIWSGGTGWAGGQAWGSMRYIWSGNEPAWEASKASWTQSLSASRAAGSNTYWVADDWVPPAAPVTPPPAGVTP